MYECSHQIQALNSFRERESALHNLIHVCRWYTECVCTVTNISNTKYSSKNILWSGCKIFGRFQKKREKGHNNHKSKKNNNNQKLSNALNNHLWIHLLILTWSFDWLTFRGKCENVLNKSALKNVGNSCTSFMLNNMHMLWFKFFLGLMFFELVSILFAIVLDYGNEYWQKNIKIEPVLKILHQN